MNPWIVSLGVGFVVFGLVVVGGSTLAGFMIGCVGACMIGGGMTRP